MTGADVDLIIVGAGTAGCVLAARLSEDPALKILLLEAGPPDRNPWIHIPVGFSRLLHNPNVNWCFATEPQTQLNERRIFWPRGRVLGGSSSINGMIWVKGQPQDYDAWAHQCGDENWCWNAVESVFRDCEDAPHDADSALGRGGTIALSRLPVSHPLSDAFIAAGLAKGYSRLTDLTLSGREGFGEYLITSHNGRRVSAVTAYLKPAGSRKNLRIATGTRVLSLKLGNGRIRGVWVKRGAAEQLIAARKGVVLAAGAVSSPHLLLLSGIGAAARLKHFGVEPTINLPAVGENLQDHFGVRLIAKVNRPITVNDDFRRPWRLARYALRYAVFRQGPLAIGGAYAGAFYRSGSNIKRPDIQVHFLPLSSERHGWSFHPFSGITANICQLRPYSRGRITLKSADPLQAAAIDPAYLDDPRDREILLNGLKIGRNVLAAPPLSQHFGATEVLPGTRVQDDHSLLDYARTHGSTVFHPVGTCAMGQDAATSVVSSKLKVHGISNLWVADASVMPTIPSGNTNAAVLMIAEKAAGLIRAG